jgi:ATP-dependent RNA helicase RhlE
MEELPCQKHMKFEKYDLSDALKRNLEQLGFRRPTDIQFKSIAPILRGEDVLAVAQTGTGKTAAFAIPIIERIHSGKRSKRVEGIGCLVMVPTRELAKQIAGVFEQLAAHTRASVYSLHGGEDQDPQIQTLQRGIDVLVATPGRMFDLINQGHLDVSTVEILVLDEADHMLGLGFIEDIRYIKKLLPQRHQTVFMAATLDKGIKKIAYSLVRGNAIHIQISPKNPVSKQVDHFVQFVKHDDKRFFLEEFLNENAQSKVIVFVRTRVRAERVVQAMSRVAIETCLLHGEMDQSERIVVLDAFRANAHRVMVATDMCARGIDVPDVEFVINYDLPVQAENYVHRVGRTGRGERRGVAITYCSQEEREQLEVIEQYIDKPIDELRIGRKDYRRTVDLMKKTDTGPEQFFSSLEVLVQEQGLYENRRLKGKKRR